MATGLMCRHFRLIRALRYNTRMNTSVKTPGKDPSLLSVAPMMGWTDRHERYFLRQISRHCLLYTEMVTASALIHNRQTVGDQRRLLAHHEAEHPVAIQLGGSEPAALADCAAMAEDAGFDEVNLNVGCPSDRVRSGSFGACLMASPELVAECVSAMNRRVSVPVTVKCRVGIDDMDGYDDMKGFVDTVAEAGCDTFIVHARKAWLQGLSPKQNREIPPLKYHYVYRLKQERPDLTVVINGGIRTMQEVHEHLGHVDGVMMGREAYYNPYILAAVDGDLYGDVSAPTRTRKQIVEAMVPYIAQQVADGVPMHAVTRHMLGLFAGCPGARAWRRTLSEGTHRLQEGDVKAAISLLEQAMARVTEIKATEIKVTENGVTESRAMQGPGSAEQDDESVAITG